MGFDQDTLTVSATSEISTTSKDMSEAFKWKKGKKLYGTYAKNSEGLKAYRKDIESAYGNESDYDSNVIYIDTLGQQRKSVSEQYNKLKK
jgi:hypothetical protein